MLSIHRKLSPTRIGAGLAGIATISLAALALTASGSEAAERLRDGIGAATQKQAAPVPPAPPAPPAVAAVPATPATPATPAVPAAPAAPATPATPATPAAPAAAHRVTRIDQAVTDGKTVRKMVIVQRDGKRQEIVMPDLAAIQANVPEIREGNCGKGDGATVEHRTEGTRQVMIICRDRIAAISANATRMAARSDHAAQMAESSKKMAFRSALMGLNNARVAIAKQAGLSPEQRAEELAGIDEAIAELRDDADSEN